MKFIADNIQIAPSGGFTGIGTGKLNTINGDSAGVSTLASIISTVIGIMTVIAIIWFIFTLITGAIGIISSGGDKQALENSRKKITTGIIGVVVVLISVLLVSFIGKIFGIDFLDLTTLFNNIIGTT